MHTLTFKAPDELLAKLDKFSGLRERSKSYLIRKAVEAYLAEMEEDEADYAIAAERLNNPAGPSIPLEEIERKYGLAD